MLLTQWLMVFFLGVCVGAFAVIVASVIAYLFRDR